MENITTVAQLEALYGIPGNALTVKEIDHISPHYRAMIEASPFALLATVGPEGLDCSPRGDVLGFVRIHDMRTLMLPDRRGNNRVDSLRNIVGDARVALLFMISGIGNTLRVNGRAILSIEPSLLASFAIEQKAPRSVTIISIETIFFQCARALVRSDLWNASKHVSLAAIPTAGQILATLSAQRAPTAGSAEPIDGIAYDAAWPERAKQTMW
jgi:PPOX class probable FMN-dependent enzyme